jgi:hypothetical protein
MWLRLIRVAIFGVGFLSSTSASSEPLLPQRPNLLTTDLMPKVENGALVVHLEPATYVLTYPPDLSRLKGWSSLAQRVIIRGADDGRTRLVGSKLYYSRPPRPDEPLPEHLTRDGTLRVIDADDDIRKLWVQGKEYAIGCGSQSVLSVFQGGQRLSCARWPKSGFTRTETVVADDPKAAAIIVPAEKVGEWRDSLGLSIAGYFGEDWFFEIGGVKSVAPDGTLWLAPLMQPYRFLPGLRYAVLGAPSDLSGPGEYISDPAGGRIFLRGFADAAPDAEVEIPVARTLLRVVGGTNITVENVSLGMSWGNALEIVDASNLTFRNSRVEHVGDTGISVVGGKNVVIDHTVVTDIGGSGIVLKGGNRQTLEPAGHAVRRSVITNTSVLARTYHPAVSLEGVGNAVEDSYIADLPHVAIMFSGNDHRIAYNEITSVVTETSDSGAIYAGRDWTWRGTVIGGNYLHDILPASEPSMIRDSKGKPHPMEVKGVYFDDMLSGNSVTGNIFADVGKPVFIGGGRNNSVQGNFFLRPAGPAMFLDARGMKTPSSADDPQSTIRKRLVSVPFDGPIYAARYPALKNILEEKPGEPIGNSFEDNVIVSGTAFYCAVQAKLLAKMAKTTEAYQPDIPKNSLEAIWDWTMTNWPKDAGSGVRRALQASISRIRENQLLWSKIR